MNNIKLWIIVLFIDGNDKTEDKYKNMRDRDDTIGIQIWAWLIIAEIVFFQW